MFAFSKLHTAPPPPRLLPILQYPTRALLDTPSSLPQDGIYACGGIGFQQKLQSLLHTRAHYAYPSLSAPQVGWDAKLFVGFDATHSLRAFIHPRVVHTSQETCWTWEPCASCGFLLHYIERPAEVKLEASNEVGVREAVTLKGMAARMALHEMDHLEGRCYYQRVRDTRHAVPFSGFTIMEQWPVDFPSIEARSTQLYSLYRPPYTIQMDSLPESNFLYRTFGQEIYPGKDEDELMAQYMALGSAKAT